MIPPRQTDVMQAVDTSDNEHTGGTMSALRKENGHGHEHLYEIPKPTENLDGKIFDARGATVHPATPTLMARLNEKSKDEFTITKGMAAIIAICLTAVGLFIGYIIPEIRQGARESEKVLSMEKEISETRDDMRELKAQFTKIQESLQQQAVRDGEKRGYELKAAEGSHGK